MPTAGWPSAPKRRHEALVHLAGKYHQRDVPRLGIGYAQSIYKLAFGAKPFHHARQLHAAAMHHGHLVAIANQIGNGANAALQQLWNLPGPHRQALRHTSCQPLRFVPAKHHVHVLHCLSRCALQQIVEATHNHRAPSIA